jgi:uncharacterized protein
MRTAIVMLVMLAALALAFGQDHPEPAKSQPADVGPGRVAWFDLTTTDLAKSRDFYGKLFGWEFAPVMGGGALEIVAGGAGIGTIRVADGAISAFNGVVYVQVTDLQDSCRKATELGGVVPPGFPFDLPTGTGAIALVMDPGGHPIGMYSRALLAPKDPAAKDPAPR